MKTQHDHFLSRFSRDWVKIVLVGILLVGASLRLWGSSRQFPFFLDQADDLFSVRNIAHQITQGQFAGLPLEGEPGEYPSAIYPEGRIYHGALFLYLLLPFAWVVQFDPYGVVVLFILMGIVNVYLIYRVGTLLFDSSAGLIAAMLASISYWMVVQSRTIWPTTPVTFFVLLSALGLGYILHGKRWGWTLYLGAAAVGSQMHAGGYVYLLYALLFAPFVWRRAPLKGGFFIITVLALVAPLVPTALVELRHTFILGGSIMAFVQATLSTLWQGSFSFFWAVAWEQWAFLVQSMGVRSALDDNIAAIAGIVVASWLVCAVLLWRRIKPSSIKPSATLAYWFVGAWFVFFFVLPWLISLYYGHGVTEGVYSRVQFALPFVFFGCAIVARALFSQSLLGKISLAILLASSVGINMYSIYWYVFKDAQADMSYETYKTIAFYLSRDAVGQPYEIVEVNRRDVGRALLYIQLDEHLDMPSRLNGKGSVVSWPGGIELSGQQPQVTYAIALSATEEWNGAKEVFRNGGYVVFKRPSGIQKEP
jgi:hypothetical protein